jgi:hypothetical protein
MIQALQRKLKQQSDTIEELLNEVQTEKIKLKT